MNEDLIKLKELEALRALHTDIDHKLDHEHFDDFTRMRMKKERLELRQKIVQLEQYIYPDIIA